MIKNNGSNWDMNCKDEMSWGSDELETRIGLMPEGEDQPAQDVGGDGVEDEDADV